MYANCGRREHETLHRIEPLAREGFRAGGAFAFRAQRGRPRHRTGLPAHRLRKTLDRLAGILPRRGRVPPEDGRRTGGPAFPSGLSHRRPDRRLLRRLQQQHDLAPVPLLLRLYPLQGELPRGLPRREPSFLRDGLPAGRAGRRRMGAGLPTDAPAGHAAGSPPRTGDRLFPPHSLPLLRTVPHPARTRRSAAGAAGRRPRGLPHARLHAPFHQHGGTGPAPRFPARRGAARRPRGPRERPAHGDQLRPLPRRLAEARGPRRRRTHPPPLRIAQAGARRGPARLQQGHPPPALGLRRISGAPSRIPRAGDLGHGDRPLARPRGKLRRTEDAHRRGDRLDQRQVLHDGLDAGVLLLPRLRLRGAGRHVLRRRRGARHTPARRHEPRGQGVHSHQDRQSGRTDTERNGRGCRRTVRGPADQSQRHRTDRAEPCRGIDHAGRGAAAAHPRHATDDLHADRGQMGRRFPRRAGRHPAEKRTPAPQTHLRRNDGGRQGGLRPGEAAAAPVRLRRNAGRPASPSRGRRADARTARPAAQTLRGPGQPGRHQQRPRPRDTRTVVRRAAPVARGRARRVL